MEVHHHPDLHHDRKRFREYLLEFLMIFMAVTLGFIAENIRENISERSKAKELAKALYGEVYADSVSMHGKMELRLRKEAQMEYFRGYMRDSSLTNLSPDFYPAFAWTFILTTSILFEPDNAVMNQLINSGTLRYFKSVRLQEDIGRLNVAMANIRSRNEQELHFVDQYTRPFMLHHFDFQWQDEYSQKGALSISQALNQVNFRSVKVPLIKNLQDLNRQDAEGLAAYYLLIIRGTRQIHYANYLVFNHQLLQTLREQFGIKDK